VGKEKGGPLASGEEGADTLFFFGNDGRRGRRKGGENAFVTGLWQKKRSKHLEGEALLKAAKKQGVAQEKKKKGIEQV